MLRGSALANAPRMSLSALNQNEDPDRQVRIWLLGSVTVKGTVYYRIAGRFASSSQTWQVNRRYSEFLVLRETLIKFFSRSPDTCPGCLNYLHSIKQFDFPKKHVFVSRSQIVVNYRTQALRSFMNLLASWTFSNSPKCPTCGGFAFDIVRNFCLESAEPVGDSNMSYIRDSFVVSTFTEAGRRSSLSRQNSFIPSPGGYNMGSQRASDAPFRNTIGGSRPHERREHADEGDAYEAFNNYLVRQPSMESKNMHSRSAINIRQHQQHDEQPELPRTNSARQAQAQHRASTGGSSSSTAPAGAQSSSITGSFLFYQDGVERENSTSAANTQRGAGASAASSQRPLPSNSSKRGILKNWKDVRNDRVAQTSDNGSYTSLGASSSASGEATSHAPRSSHRDAQQDRNARRSQNDSYFSLGASSVHSRNTSEHEKPSTQREDRAKGREYTHEQQLHNEGRYDRSENNSYLSLGASSAGDLEEEYHSHHPSVLPSPTRREPVYVQAPPAHKHTSGSSKRLNHPGSPPPSSTQRQSQRALSPPPPARRESRDPRGSPLRASQRRSHRVRSPPRSPIQYNSKDSRSSRNHDHRQQPQHQSQKKKHSTHVVADEKRFAADSLIDNSLRFDGMTAVAVEDVSDSDDDEIDVTGLAINPKLPRKSTSGQDLWQPWELAKAG